MPVFSPIKKLRNLYFSADKNLANSLRNITGLVPLNLRLYILALTHSSRSSNNEVGMRANNERLEYLGDAVLDLVIADILFKKYPKKDEGFLTELRSRIVNAVFLDFLARKIGLDKLLIFDQRNFSLSNKNKNIHADALEALIGALYLDLGYKKTYAFIQNRLVKLYVDFDNLLSTEYNYKSKILEWSQKHNRKITFEHIQTNDDGHKKQFIVQLMLDDEPQTQGTDFTKKQAEQIAAERFFAKLKASGKL